MRMSKEIQNVSIDQVDITNLSLVEESDLNYILQNSKDATIFHTIEWNKILIEVFGVNNKTLIAKRNGSPVGMYTFYNLKQHNFIRTCMSPIYKFESVYGGPLAIDNSHHVIENLLKQSERLFGVMVYSVQTPPNYNMYPLIKRGYDINTWYTSILNLHKSEDELWSGLNKKTRNMVRKAKKNNVNIVEGCTSSVADYYEMIYETFVRAGVDNILPLYFYESIIKNLKPKNMMKMLLAEYNDKAIAGAIFLLYKNTLYYWHGASYREYNYVAPNNLIQWEIIKWAKKNGYKYYDLVRIEPDTLPGIATFKMGWGGDTAEFCYAVKRKRIYEFLRKIKSLYIKAMDVHDGK